GVPGVAGALELDHGPDGVVGAGVQIAQVRAAAGVAELAGAVGELLGLVAVSLAVRDGDQVGAGAGILLVAGAGEQRLGARRVLGRSEAAQEQIAQVSAGARPPRLALLLQEGQGAARFRRLSDAERERAGLVSAAVLVLELAGLAEELHGARLVATDAETVLHAIAELVAGGALAAVAGVLQIGGAAGGEEQEREKHGGHGSGQSSALSSRERMGSSRTSAGTEPSSGKKRSRARRTSSPVWSSGAMRRKASPPRRPRVYQSRCLRSSRMAASSAALASRACVSCPPFGRKARGRGAPSGRLRRYLPCLSSMASRTWRRMVARHSPRVTSGGVSPRSSASSSRKIHGYPQAPRAMRAASAPVSSSMRRAASAVKRSPEPQTEIP